MLILFLFYIWFEQKRKMVRFFNEYNILILKVLFLQKAFLHGYCCISYCFLVTARMDSSPTDEQMGTFVVYIQFIMVWQALQLTSILKVDTRTSGFQ